MMLLLAAIAVSATFLILLCRGDPKRRRSARLPGTPQRTTARRWFTAASLLPGLAYALGGDGAAFLIWLGGYAVVGWLITLAFSARQDRAT